MKTRLAAGHRLEMEVAQQGVLRRVFLVAGARPDLRDADDAGARRLDRAHVRERPGVNGAGDGVRVRGRAAERLGKLAGRRRLPHPVRPDEQVGTGQAAFPQGVLQDGDGIGLSEDVLEHC